MLDEELEILIEYFNEEKKILENAIEKYVEESDYKFARYQYKGLIIVNHTLRILNKLKDPLYDRKEQLKLRKDSIEKMIKSKDYGPFAELHNNSNAVEKFFESQLKEIDVNAQKLSEKPLPVFIPGQEVDNAIYDIIEKKSKNIKLWIDKNSNLYLTFSLYNENFLKINFTPNRLLNEEIYFLQRGKKSLKNWGFTFDIDEDCYTYIYNLDNFISTTFLKTFLSRIFFDIFLFQIDNPTFIEYED